MLDLCSLHDWQYSVGETLCFGNALGIHLIVLLVPLLGGSILGHWRLKKQKEQLGFQLLMKHKSKSTRKTGKSKFTHLLTHQFADLHEIKLVHWVCAASRAVVRASKACWNL